VEKSFLWRACHDILPTCLNLELLPNMWTGKRHYYAHYLAMTFCGRCLECEECEAAKIFQRWVLFYQACTGRLPQMFKRGDKNVCRDFEEVSSSIPIYWSSKLW
jgi:hypothetical protein